MGLMSVAEMLLHLEGLLPKESKMLLNGKCVAVNKANMGKFLHSFPMIDSELDVYMSTIDRTPKDAERDFQNQRDGAGLKSAWDISPRGFEIILRSLVAFNGATTSTVMQNYSWSHALPALTQADGDLYEMTQKTADGKSTAVAAAVVKIKSIPVKLKPDTEHRLKTLIKSIKLSGWHRLQIGAICVEAESNGSPLQDVYDYIEDKHKWSLTRIQNLARAAKVAIEIDGHIQIHTDTPHSHRKIQSDLVALPLAPFLKTPEDVRKNKAEVLRVLEDAKVKAKAKGMPVNESYIRAELKENTKLEKPPKRPPLLGKSLRAAEKSIAKAVEALQAYKGSWKDEFNEPSGLIIEGFKVFMDLIPDSFKEGQPVEPIKTAVEPVESKSAPKQKKNRHRATAFDFTGWSQAPDSANMELVMKATDPKFSGAIPATIKEALELYHKTAETQWLETKPIRLGKRSYAKYIGGVWKTFLTKKTLELGTDGTVIV